MAGRCFANDRRAHTLMVMRGREAGRRGPTETGGQSKLNISDSEVSSRGVRHFRKRRERRKRYSNLSTDVTVKENPDAGGGGVSSGNDRRPQTRGMPIFRDIKPTPNRPPPSASDPLDDDHLLIHDGPPAALPHKQSRRLKR
jgi:hypothetical protein